jgi:hypothetical protein
MCFAVVERPRSFADLACAAARTATGLLGWSPDEFWQATVADLLLALDARAGPDRACGSRADLARLLQEFPDE